MNNNKEHWDNIYRTKQPDELSWVQDKPSASLDFIHSFHLPPEAAVIDVGGGDSKLTDFLLDEGFSNITVLDISEEAINRAKARLGEKANKVTWIVKDITEFEPVCVYDVWHDRATFHFLAEEDMVKKYLSIAGKATKGFAVIATFSNNGPAKCSGLNVHQYSESQLEHAFAQYFHKIRCITQSHETPFKTKQDFLFCSFKKR